jgi:N-acetylneuraminic acid mutarotase
MFSIIAEHYLRKTLYQNPVWKDVMRKDIICLLTISTIACLILPTFNCAFAVEDEWVSKADMPVEKAYLRAATVEGKIYIPSNSTYVYDPATDTWTTKSSKQVSVSCFAIAEYQNKIYCIGGQNSAISNVALTQVYDPATDTWTTKTSMPTARYGATAQVVDGKIYVIGGANLLGYDLGVEALNVTEVYDPLTDTWTTKASVPHAVPSVSAVIDNKIYLIGSGITQIYDPQIDTWSTDASSKKTLDMDSYDLNAAAGATTGEMAPKRIYVYDGTNLYVYNPYDDIWTKITPPPTSRQYAGIAVVNDQLYVIGGMSYPIPSMKLSYFELHATNEQYTPVGYGATPTPSPSPIPTATPKPVSAQVIVAVSIAVVAVATVSVALIIYWKKRRPVEG